MNKAFTRETDDADEDDAPEARRRCRPARATT